MRSALFLQRGWIPGTCIKVDDFTPPTSPAPAEILYFLSHLHADHVVGLDPHFHHGRLYCSSETARLLRDKSCPRYAGLPHAKIEVLELNTSRLIQLPGPGPTVTGTSTSTVTSQAMSLRTTDTTTKKTKLQLNTVPVTATTADSESSTTVTVTVTVTAESESESESEISSSSRSKPSCTTVVTRRTRTNLNYMTVIAFTANHCYGSVMFLFDGPFGRILHTGDCRYDRIAFEELCNYMSSTQIMLDTLYFDATFLHPACIFPTRMEATDMLLTFMKRYPTSTRFYIACGRLGLEPLLIQLRHELRQPLFVDAQMFGDLSGDGVGSQPLSLSDSTHTVAEPGTGYAEFQTLRRMPHVMACITQNPSMRNKCRIHLVPSVRLQQRAKDIHARERKERKDTEAQSVRLSRDMSYRSESVVVKPSIMWYIEHMLSMGPQVFRVPQRDACGVYHIPYSFHSSYGELIEFLSKVPTRYAIPTHLARPYHVSTSADFSTVCDSALAMLPPPLGKTLASGHDSTAHHAAVTAQREALARRYQSLALNDGDSRNSYKRKRYGSSRQQLLASKSTESDPASNAFEDSDSRCDYQARLQKIPKILRTSDDIVLSEVFTSNNPGQKLNHITSDDVAMAVSHAVANAPHSRTRTHTRTRTCSHSIVDLDKQQQQQQLRVVDTSRSRKRMQNVKLTRHSSSPVKSSRHRVARRQNSAAAAAASSSRDSILNHIQNMSAEDIVNVKAGSRSGPVPGVVHGATESIQATERDTQSVLDHSASECSVTYTPSDHLVVYVASDVCTKHRRRIMDYISSHRSSVACSHVLNASVHVAYVTSVSLALLKFAARTKFNDTHKGLVTGSKSHCQSQSTHSLNQAPTVTAWWERDQACYSTRSYDNDHDDDRLSLRLSAASKTKYNCYAVGMSQPLFVIVPRRSTD
jgi:DNA repair metallo-beta-lactamase